MKMIFLDRDGVIIRFPGRGQYVLNDDQFQFVPGAKDAIATLTRAGYELNVISNQGCVAKKLITEEKMLEMTQRMLRDVQAAGGALNGVYYCIHETADRCDCKKPSWKLLRDATRGRHVDLTSSYFVGDSQEDMEAGKNAGCTTILVLSGRSTREEAEHFVARPDIIVKDISEAAQWILEKKS